MILEFKLPLIRPLMTETLLECHHSAAGAAAGQSCKVGEIVALFSTEANEATDQPPQRGIRFATATIIHHGGMWSGNVH